MDDRNANRMMAFLKRRPDFLIVGAQKAGTTALQIYLSQHPRIQCAVKKEVNFFKHDKFYGRGEAWYARQFPRRWRPGVLLFEATPGYLYFPFVADRIREFDPRIKLIMLLRNPVERAYSAWNMFRLVHQDAKMKAEVLEEFYEVANPDIRRSNLDLLNSPVFPDFLACVQEEIARFQAGDAPVEDPGFVRRGIYWEQVQRFYQRFPRENILILETNELRTGRAASLNRVLRLLNLPPYDWNNVDLKEENQHRYDMKMTDSTRRLLRDFFQPHNEKLYSIIGRDFSW